MRPPGCTRLSVPSEVKTVSRCFFFIGGRKNIVSRRKTIRVMIHARLWPGRCVFHNTIAPDTDDRFPKVRAKSLFDGRVGPSRVQPEAMVRAGVQNLREAPDFLYSAIKLYANESDITMDCCNFGGPGDKDDKDDIGCCAMHVLAACGFGLFPRLRPAKPSSSATHEFLRYQRRNGQRGQSWRPGRSRRALPTACHRGGCGG